MKQLKLLKHLIEGEDAAKIKESTEALQKLVHDASSELYKQAEATQPGDQTEPNTTSESDSKEEKSKKDDTVVDAEYTEVKDS